MRVLLMTARIVPVALALMWPMATLDARPVKKLGVPHQTFATGTLASFHGQDHNGDAIADDTQDMTFRFTFTTPSAFQEPGYVVFETGRLRTGASLLLVGGRLMFIAGGSSSSANGTSVVRVVSRALEPGTQYEVVFGLELDENRDGTASDSRGAIYLSGEYAVESAYPGVQVTADIRVAGVADWSGTGPGGYGEAANGALYSEEGSSPRDFPGPGFLTSDGTLDSPLEFFADTFLDDVPSFQGPNILLITADDMNWDTVGVFGGPKPTVTPNIDRLASEGMIFRRAYVSVAVCQPSRESLLTGLYPHNNGGEGFEPINPSVTTIVEILDNLGYRLGILSKTRHVAPASEFPWDLKLTAGDLAQGRNPERFYEASKSFMQQALDDGKPFFLMANSNDPHRPFHSSAQEANRFNSVVRNSFATPSRVYAPGDVPVPGFLPDLANIRLEISQYYSSSRRCDDTVGKLLDALDQVGARNDTIVIFLSDNGIAVPFAKTNVWLHSTRTPLIIRWPDVVTPGSEDSRHFVVGTDLTPTLLDALGVSHSLALDGFSFLPLLQGAEFQAGRLHAVTVFHETAARRRYEMRAVQGERYGYIFNAWSSGQREFKNESQSGLTWNAMMQARRTHADIRARVDHFSLRTPEEFYDYTQDVDALNNLIDRRDVVEDIGQARQDLLAWMTKTGDPLRSAFLAYLRANPLPSGQDFRRGDGNDDGAVDVSDAIANLTFQFLGTFQPPCLDALDFDDSGMIDVSDPIANLTHQFVGGPPPAAPGKETCGVDPGEDELSCESFATCPGGG